MPVKLQISLVTDLDKQMFKHIFWCLNEAKPETIAIKQMTDKKNCCISQSTQLPQSRLKKLSQAKQQVESSQAGWGRIWRQIERYKVDMQCQRGKCGKGCREQTKLAYSTSINALFVYHVCQYRKGYLMQQDINKWCNWQSINSSVHRGEGTVWGMQCIGDYNSKVEHGEKKLQFSVICLLPVQFIVHVDVPIGVYMWSRV